MPERPRPSSSLGLLLAGLLLAAAPVGGALAAQGAGKGPGAKGGGRAAPVVLAEAREAVLAPRRWVPGLVAARREARLAAEEPGRLLAVAEVGTRARAGEVLARQDGRLLELALEEARAAAGQVEARLAYLDKELDRQAALARHDLAAATRLDELRAQRDGARQELAAARARVQALAERLERLRLRAPFAGVVAERLMRPGERAGAGDPVLRLVDPSAVEVRAPVPVHLAKLLRPGQRLPVEGPQGRTEGEVLAVAPPAEPRAHAATLRLGLAEPWPVGEAVRVAVPEAPPRRVLAVPRDALVLRREGAAVFRVGPDGAAQRVPVTPGVAQGELIAVAGDLRPGDRVIVRGAERLRPGQRVRPLPPAAP